MSEIDFNKNVNFGEKSFMIKSYGNKRMFGC